MSIHLEVICDEAMFEKSSCGVLDGEVPATEDLEAHIHAVALPKHPGVLVANGSSG